MGNGIDLRNIKRFKLLDSMVKRRKTSNGENENRFIDFFIFVG